MIRSWVDRLSWAVVGAAVTATLVVALALAFFAHPNGDDFCYAADARDLGVIGCTARGYLMEGGRFSGYLLACGAKAAVSLEGEYPTGLLLLFAASLLSIWFFLRSVLPLERDPTLSWWLAIVGLAIYWAGMPHPGETFYWLDSAYPYLVAVLLGLVVIGLLARGGKVHRWTETLGIAALAMFAAGFHELFALILVAVLLAGGLRAWWLGAPRQVAWWVSAGCVLVAFAVVVLAPGNEIRARGTAPAEVKSIATAILEMVRMWIRVLDTPGAREPIGSYSPLGWVVDAKLLAATVLFVTAPRARALPSGWVEELPLWWRLAVPAGTVGALSASFLVGGWALGRTLPLRAFDALYLVFLAGWFVSVFVFTRDGQGAVGPEGSRTTTLRFLSASTLALGLMFSPNFKYAVRDLLQGRASAFDREMDRRYEVAATRSSGDGSLVAFEIDPWPTSFYRNDFWEDPTQIPNQCAARYFELESVRLERR